MITLDEAIVAAPPRDVYTLVRDLEGWARHLAHYRFVRYHQRDAQGNGRVEMSANRPFGPLNWPTWWTSDVVMDDAAPAIRFRHVAGITKGMDVEWSFHPHPAGTHVKLLHTWDGPAWPLISWVAANLVIGPVFVHGIASRTLAGLQRVAEATARQPAAHGAADSARGGRP